MTSNDFDDTFAYSSERPDGVMLQWATGLTATNRQMVAGWFIETGKDADLDDALQSIGIPRVSIKHGSGNVVTHWHLEKAELLVVAQDTEPAGRGTVYKWVDGRSKYKARVYVRALVDAGYVAPLLISFKSTLTNDIRATLRRLYELVQATGNKSIPIYAFWLPTGPGDDVAKGTVQTKNVAPPIAILPDEMTREWLVGQYAKKTHPDLIAHVEQELPAAIAWSVKECGEETTTATPSDAATEEPLSFPPPNDIAVAEQAFYKAHGRLLKSRTWMSVCDYMGWSYDWKPETVEDWAWAVGEVAKQHQATA